MQVNASSYGIDYIFLLWTGQYDIFEYSFEEEWEERVDSWNPLWMNWTSTTVKHVVTRIVNTTQFASEYLLEREECFACCCSQFSDDSSAHLPYREGAESLNISSLERCPGQRSRWPTFCLDGDALGSDCMQDSDCPGNASCGYDEEIVKCWDEDLGIRCQPIWNRPNMTTAIHFTNPEVYQRLYAPDASGRIISTGNLEEITSIGVQVSSSQLITSMLPAPCLRYE